MTNTILSASVEALIAAASSRLQTAMPASGSYCILLSVGSGDAAQAAAASLRRQLERDPRVLFSQVSRQPTGPVADSNRPAEHVQSEEFLITPPPSIVVSVSESKGHYYLAARAPGGDPLGPPLNGWLWVIDGP